MRSFSCLINKTYKKVSYPLPVVLEPMYFDHLSPLSLIVDEIKSGEIMLIEFYNDKVFRLFLVENTSLNQIYGDPITKGIIFETKCIDLNKKNEIEKYIKTIYNQLKLSEMIINKNDLTDLENELMKYFLVCKNQDKIDLKKIRSVIFKNCKNHKFAEKIYFHIKNKPFNYFTYSSSNVRIDLNLLTVQIEHGS